MIGTRSFTGRRRIAIATLLIGLAAGAAHAEVVARQPSDLLDWFVGLQTDARPGAERLQVINGVVVRTAVATTRLAPDALIERLAALVPATPGPERGTPVRDADEAIERIHAVYAHGLRRPFRSQGAGWHAFGRLAGGPPAEVDALLAQIGADGRVGSTGAGGFIVVAFDEGDTTRVVTTRFGEDFSPAAFVGAHDGDVGGGDVPGLDRFPGTRRSLTLSEFPSGAPAGHLVGYLGGGSVEAHRRHWEAQLAAIGLQAQAVPLGRSDRALLVARDGDREISIYTTRSAERGNEVLDLVQVRTSGAARGSKLEAR